MRPCVPKWRHTFSLNNPPSHQSCSLILLGFHRLNDRLFVVKNFNPFFLQIIKSMLEENNEEPGAKYSLVAMETTEKLQRICSNIVGYCKTVMSLTGIDILFFLLIPIFLSPLFWRFLLFLFICIRCDVWAGYNITHTVTHFEGQVKGWGGGGGGAGNVQLIARLSLIDLEVDFLRRDGVLTRVKFTWVSRIGQCMEGGA